MSAKIFYIIILVVNCFLSAFSQVLLKKASLKNYGSFLRQYLNPLVISGYGLFFVVLCVNIFLLRYLPLSIENSVCESLPMLLSFVFGRFFFAEKLGISNIIGGIFIVSGIFIILF